AVVNRRRVLLIVEAAAWAIAAAVGATVVLPGSRIVSAALTTLAAVLVAGWRWPLARRKAALEAIERADPLSRNVFVTAEELLSGRLTTGAELRTRVMADAAAVARRIDHASLAPIAPAARASAAAVAAAVLMWSFPIWRSRAVDVVSNGRARVPGAAVPVDATLRVRAAIDPPSYTGLQRAAIDDPEQLQAIEGSTLTLTVDAAGDHLTVEHDDASSVLTKAIGGFIYRALLEKTGFIVVSAGSARRTIPVIVSPDALPTVRITAPGRDLVYAGTNARIAFTARATDDFGLRSLALRYTKVSGSGENFAFEDGAIPLDVARETPREWSGRATRSLEQLNLKEGDIFVYRAVASDAREDAGSASSDAFFIEISKLGAAAADAFTLPQEETKYALSEQMLILETERLQQRRSALAEADLREQALNLAVEQRMIRAELVFMLGGEVENEEAEAEQSNELQEGRLENRGQRDVRAATIAMSRAEKSLGGASLADALVAERAAVAALQRAFARDRYILRALGARSQLDLARRLSGNLAGAADWRRVVPDAPANRRAALMQDLMRGIGDLRSGEPALASAARLLAEEAIRIDAASTAMRQVATELQRAAGAPDADARDRALSAARQAAASEARRAHADPVLDVRIPAAPLVGAFADAVAGARLELSRGGGTVSERSGSASSERRQRR
ncbi:MAG TPA: hypothetical protein VKD69_25140, partial [Vicinamibacterales bacterium]|nr:hypothetical protein [Vicinamibacterales bacterium]